MENLTVYERIVRLAKARGETIADTALTIGVKPGTAQAYKSDPTIEPRPHILKKLAELEVLEGLEKPRVTIALGVADRDTIDADMLEPHLKDYLQAALDVMKRLGKDRLLTMEVNPAEVLGLMRGETQAEQESHLAVEMIFRRAPENIKKQAHDYLTKLAGKHATNH